MKVVIDKLLEERVPFKRNFDLKSISYSCTGGEVEVYITPICVDQLMLVIRTLKENDIDYILSGGSTNLLYLDFVRYKCVVSTTYIGNVDYDSANELVVVDSGYELSKFVRQNLIRGFVGYEGLEGIPGTIGGALFQNAGAYGYNISDHLVSVEVLDENNNVQVLMKDDCSFAMRESIFQKRKLIILRAIFKNKKGDLNLAASKIETYHIARHAHQEWVYPNLGSSFVTTTNVYDSFGEGKVVYKSLLIIVKIITNNSIYKRLFRGKPNNKLRNRLVQYFFGLNSCENNYSHKSINTFVNKSGLSIDVIKYYRDLDKILGGDAKLENEIAYSGVSKVVDKASNQIFLEIVEEHPRIRSKLK
ncbi:putative UDP-N-acetylmuramate dehydrogenase [Vibrio coralliirubri]|uniref:FAD-binding protein n=1 Tax=Vibrio coralliirubri TaxID=1516159 RepID=UPI0006382C6C|nr:FAD-binding protein [Vibrio coralliirubri]CDT76194.1 putative UDP-N-acetylmuramate dehydrogenase [Vibrio coralliirubri]